MSECQYCRMEVGHMPSCPESKRTRDWVKEVEALREKLAAAYREDALPSIQSRWYPAMRAAEVKAEAAEARLKEVEKASLDQWIEREDAWRIARDNFRKLWKDADARAERLRGVLQSIANIDGEFDPCDAAEAALAADSAAPSDSQEAIDAALLQATKKIGWDTGEQGGEHE